MEQNIRIKIAEREHMLKAASAEHEAAIRKAAEIIDKRIVYLQKKHPAKSLTDIISITALTIGIDCVKLQDKLEKAEKEGQQLLNELNGYLADIEKISR